MESNQMNGNGIHLMDGIEERAGRQFEELAGYGLRPSNANEFRYSKAIPLPPLHHSCLLSLSCPGEERASWCCLLPSIQKNKVKGRGMNVELIGREIYNPSPRN